MNITFPSYLTSPNDCEVLINVAACYTPEYHGSREDPPTPAEVEIYEIVPPTFPDGVVRHIDFDSLAESEQERLITEAFAVAEDGIAAEAEQDDATEYHREIEAEEFDEPEL